MKRAVLVLMALLAPLACGNEEPDAVNFDLVLEARDRVDDDGHYRFTTNLGWTITLEDAAFSLGPVYLIEESSLHLAKAQPDLIDRLSSLLVPKAHAHAGTDFAGTTVVGEALDATAWKLLEGPAELDAGHGISVRAQSVDIEVTTSEPSSALAGHAASLVFTVEREDEGSSPRARLEAQFDWEVRAPERTITSIPTDLTLTDGGTLILSVDPASWFDGISFESAFAPPTGAALAPGGARRLEHGESLHSALRRRLLTVSAWRARFEPSDPR